MGANPRPASSEESMGNRIQRLRKAKRMTQEALATATSIPVASIRNYEQDHRKPKTDSLRKLAIALGVTLDDLVGMPRTNPS